MDSSPPTLRYDAWLWEKRARRAERAGRHLAAEYYRSMAYDGRDQWRPGAISTSPVPVVPAWLRLAGLLRGGK